MTRFAMPQARRQFLSTAAFGAAAFTVAGAFAEELVRTAEQMEGPFYPDKLPLDTDNDLLIINDGITPAVGEITHLTGKVLDARGNPLRNVVVEIWQCDAEGAYLHSRGASTGKRDGNFQGYGRFLTSSTGEYYFRTIKPVPYPGRPAPHIHFRISQNGRAILTSQFFINGHEGNKEDGVFLGLTDPIDREFVMLDFEPMENSRIGELAASMDIVIGRTPPEREEPGPGRRPPLRTRRPSPRGEPGGIR
jgi:protocatechuate 3,4-dioxygenase beta subunit